MLESVKNIAASYLITPGVPTTQGRFLNASMSSYAWAYQHTDHFSEQKLRALQLRNLRKMLLHAANTVPYWRGLFNEINFSPQHFPRQGLLSRIPPMTREHIKKIPREDLLSTTVRRKRRVPASTSGSTGEPLSFFQDLYEIPCRSAVAFLTMHYAGFVRKKPVLVLGRDAPHLRLIGKVVFGVSLESDTFREQKFYPMLMSYRPNVLLGTASYLLRLAHHLEKDGVTVSLGGLISTGEELDAEKRRMLEGLFKCSIGSIYAANEFAIGITCSYGRYHCLPFLNYVEVVDERGASRPDGERGEIVVTHFGNMVMPFIRYKIGDEGVIGKDLCRCGRKSKTITFLGRKPMYINMGDRPINIRFLESLLTSNCRGVKKFQIVQEAPNAITVRYLSDGEVLLDEHEVAETIRGALRRYVGMTQRIAVSLKEVNELLPNSQGKTPLFIDAVRN